MEPIKMAMVIVAWMKTKPAGTSFSYNDICAEIKARWPDLHECTVDFVFKKTIHLFAFE